MHAQQVIDNLPDTAKRNVLYSLVGSLNASVIGTASSIATRLARGGYSIIELEVEEIERLCKGTDDSDELLTNARRTVRVAQALREQLIGVTNNDEDGTIASTMKFMTDPKVKDFDPEVVKLVLKEAEVDIDPALLNSLNKVQSADRAARLSEQSGHIEWIIEHVFTSRGDFKLVETEHGGTMEFSEDNTDHIEGLSAETVERLYEKIVSAIDRARTSAVMAVLKRDKRVTLGDISLLTGSYKEALQLDAHVVH